MEEIAALLWQQAHHGRASKLKELQCMGVGSRPCLDLKPSCDQIQDRSVDHLFASSSLRSSLQLVSKSCGRPLSLLSLAEKQQHELHSSPASSSSSNESGIVASPSNERSTCNGDESSSDQSTIASFGSAVGLFVEEKSAD